MKVKYNRISSIDQSLARQIANSSKFDKVYNDKISGCISFFDRKEAKKLVAEINNISEIHINELSRIGRDIIDVLTVCKFFNDRNVNLFIENIGMYSMVNGKPNPTFSMIVSVLSNVCSMERENMLFRQRQGIESAKLSLIPKYKGRANGTKMTELQLIEKYKIVVRELNAGQSLRRSALLGQCSLGTAQRIQKILLNKKSLVA